jgi:membrane protease YdiL (CAAX protease family)
MFIEQGITPQNKFWKYLVGFILIILASAIGEVPLIIGVMAKSMMDGNGIPTDNTTMMRVLDSNLTLFLIMLSFVFAVAGVYVVVKYLHRQQFKEIVTSRTTIDWKRILFSFMVWSLFTIGSTAIMYFLNPEDFIVNFDLIPFLILFVIAVIMIPIQTSWEELVFRGYLMQGFGNLTLNRWFPLLMTSIIFGTLHIFNPEVEKMGNIILVYYIGTGLFLGIITLMDEGIELSLGFHAANNMIGALLVTADYSVFQTHSILKDISEPEVGVDVILPIAIVYPVLLFIFSKKYGWHNWKEKLTGKITLHN